MAENKKAFVLYTDIIETVKQLDNLKAGELFKHILRYVNDENPQSDDPIINLVFTPIKLQLKRDLKKYEQRAERSRINGAKGGRPKNPAGYFKTQKNPDEPRKPDTVTVTDTVTVKDTVTVINKKKKVKKEKEELVYPFETDSFKKYFNVWKQYKQDQHRFKYKSLATEQALLKQIAKDYTTENEAIEAIEYSMANGYKGIFKPQKPQNNGNSYGNTKTGTTYRDSFKRKILNDIQSAEAIEQ